MRLGGCSHALVVKSSRAGGSARCPECCSPLPSKLESSCYLGLRGRSSRDGRNHAKSHPASRISGLREGGLSGLAQGSHPSFRWALRCAPGAITGHVTSQQPIGKAGGLTRTSTSWRLPVGSRLVRGYCSNWLFLLFSLSVVKSGAIAVLVRPRLRMRSGVARRTLRRVPGQAMGLRPRALTGNGGLDGKKG